MNPFKVSQVNEYIARKLREDINLRGLPVIGEISGLSRGGRHYYFSLKDSDSIIKCAIWATNVGNIDLSLLENGMKVIVIGDISPYAKGGNYSLSVRHVEAAGQGDLMAEFNRIKELLDKEGLFDQKFKKAIPSFPYRVGVITSSTGAAIEDIKKIITSKNNFTDIMIFPTIVQGDSAVQSICDNIKLANSISENGLRIDTLIVGRGGGSPEDLAAFNDEKVARTIFASKIPIISAVGHESDFSICDFVADLRAETPTAAADIAVMDTIKLGEDIDNYKKLLYESIKYKLESEGNLLESRTDYLFSQIKNKLNEARNSVQIAALIINENNPANILNKGYAAVLDINNTIISSVNKIAENEEYRVTLKDGSFIAKAIKIEGK